jgi:subfamily B ATP-binding cassette protein MsbA
MKLFIRFFKYIFPFKKNIVLIVLANFGYAIFSLLSLSMIVPFLTMLFNHEMVSEVAPTFHFSFASVKEFFFYYMGLIINTYGKFYALLYVAGSMVVSSLLSNLCRYFGLYWLAPIRTGVMQRMRNELYDKLLVLPIAFYARQKKGDIMNRFGSDAQEIEWSVITTLQTLCRDPFQVVVFLVTLLSINLKLTLITLCVLPISGFLIAWIGRSIKHDSTKAQQLLGNMSSIFEETIGGLRIIKGYNAMEHASEKFAKENFDYYGANKRIFRISELGSPLVEFLSILSIVIIMVFAGNLILVSDELSAEVLLFYLVVFARIIPPVKQLVSALYTIRKGLPSARRIFAIIDGDEKIREKEQAQPLSEFKTQISYNNVSFSYQNTENEPNTEVLHDITFSIQKGEKVAIIGASGSGKSTLADLLSRFYDVSAGAITIDGIDIRDYKISDLRSVFGIVNQDVTLFNASVYDNIAFGLDNVTEEQVYDAAKRANAHDFIMKMEKGYQTTIGDRGLKLSGGERQRLSIARAILHNPQVLILDEATSALDNESELLVHQALEEIMQGKTAIIIAHRLSTIRHADRIICLEKGRIVKIEKSASV